MLHANFKRQVISKHVPRGFSFLCFSATLLSRGLTYAKSMFTRAKTGLCARSIRARNVLYLSYILLTPLERPTVINPNPFNMQISAPPTAWGLHTRFLFFFFHHERVSIADVIHTAADDCASGAILFVEYVIIFTCLSVASSRLCVHILCSCIFALSQNMYKDKRM